MDKKLSKEEVSKLVEEMEHFHPEYNGWTFDYMYPGCFTFSKQNIRVCFTPEWEEAGIVHCIVQDDEGHELLRNFPQLSFDNVPFTDLTTTRLMEIARPMMDRCDEISIEKIETGKRS